MSKRVWIALISAIVGVVLITLFGFFTIMVVSITRFAGGDGPWSEDVLEGEGLDKVAVVNIVGEIHGGESTPSLLGGGGAGAVDIIDQLRQAERDDAVKAVILRIDSPGGAVVASDDIASAVQRLRESKPVIASMGDVAASGGYYIASQAEQIVANRGTITGSIGVIAMLFNLEDAASKLGVKPVVLKTGDLKDAGSPFREFGAKDRKVYMRLLNESYDQFVEVVAKGRKLDESVVRKLADGRPYSGADAHANKLVDTFGDLSDAYDLTLDLANLDGDDTRLVEYRPSGGLGFPFGGLSSPVDEVKRELGLDVGLKYLYLP